jgi:hypothetical protein
MSVSDYGARTILHHTLPRYRPIRFIEPGVGTPTATAGGEILPQAKSTGNVMYITSRPGPTPYNLKENSIDNAALEEARPCARFLQLCSRLR